MIKLQTIIAEINGKGYSFGWKGEYPKNPLELINLDWDNHGNCDSDTCKECLRTQTINDELKQLYTYCLDYYLIPDLDPELFEVRDQNWNRVPSVEATIKEYLLSI